MPGWLPAGYSGYETGLVKVKDSPPGWIDPSAEAGRQVRAASGMRTVGQTSELAHAPARKHFETSFFKSCFHPLWPNRPLREFPWQLGA